ncbi:winged helix-turn-helix domain-containing protein [Streptomyces sp. NPDC046909]|uniref:ArsR/SmtB family transcription factor n=1 Tax=Streptomyces sp. NPDC046909 TaxID=3155617 RepID=UPI0033F73795
MLRIHFTPEDLRQVRIAAGPDPLWEISLSLHRLRNRRGRWAFAGWYRAARGHLSGTPLGNAVLRQVMPVVPQAAYYPDFLTPYEGCEGLDAGLAAIVDTPPDRVEREIRTLDRIVGAPAWALRLTERETRLELTRTLRSYYDTAIAPHADRIQARIDNERALQARAFLDGGIDGLLDGLSPALRWRAPVLEVDYCEDRDLYLDGRGLRVVPSYFCWNTPTSLADPGLPPTLLYPLCHDRTPESERQQDDVSLGALLGRTRAAALRALTGGATTSELARALGISAPTATHHVTVLRESGLVTSERSANTVLHTLTPVGAALLRLRQRSLDLGLSRQIKSPAAPPGPADIV